MLNRSLIKLSKRNTRRRTFVSRHNSNVINFQKNDGVGIIQLTKPKVNLIDGEFLEQLRTSLKLAETDSDVKHGIVISGLPGVFSAGLDVPYLLTLNEQQLGEWYQLFADTLYQIAKCSKPTVSAITGHCPAGGCVISIMTDYRVMANGEFTIGLNELPVGIVVPEGIIKMAGLAMGANNAALSILQGRLWNPENALRIGLVNEVVELNNVVPRSIEVLQKEFGPSHTAAFYPTKMNIRKDALESMKSQIGKSDDFVKFFFHPKMRNTLTKFVEELQKKKTK